MGAQGIGDLGSPGLVQFQVPSFLQLPEMIMQLPFDISRIVCNQITGYKFLW